MFFAVRQHKTDTFLAQRFFCDIFGDEALYWMEPADRRRFMLEDAGVRLAVAADEAQSELEAMEIQTVTMPQASDSVSPWSRRISDEASSAAETAPSMHARSMAFFT